MATNIVWDEDVADVDIDAPIDLFPVEMSPRKERQCPDCKGSGTVTRWFTRKGKSEKEETTCTTCGGSGTV